MIHKVRAHPQYITSSIRNSTTPAPLKMGEKQKTTYNVSLSGGRQTLVKRLIGGTSTVAVGSVSAKSITSSSTCLSSV